MLLHTLSPRIREGQRLRWGNAGLGVAQLIIMFYLGYKERTIRSKFRECFESSPMSVEVNLVGSQKLKKKQFPAFSCKVTVWVGFVCIHDNSLIFFAIYSALFGHLLSLLLRMKHNKSIHIVLIRVFAVLNSSQRTIQEAVIRSCVRCGIFKWFRTCSGIFLTFLREKRACSRVSLFCISGPFSQFSQ